MCVQTILENRSCYKKHNSSPQLTLEKVQKYKGSRLIKELPDTRNQGRAPWSCSGLGTASWENPALLLVETSALPDPWLAQSKSLGRQRIF